MKTSLFLAIAALSAGAAQAATLSVATAVQSQPDAASPVITVLPAGAEQPAVTDKVAAPPAGWVAVEVAGPFEAYVRNRDLTKSLDIVPGSSVYLAPKETAGVLTTFAKGDKAEITGLHGGWTQIHLDKAIVGYIQTSPAQAEPIAAPALAAPPVASPAAAAPAPAARAAADVPLSRLYEGTLTSTKSILVPKRPYDWQIVDSSGKRIAYVNLEKILLTDQIENYGGRAVVVLGSLRPVKDTDDLVIDAVGLRLK
ncbi:MAG TPA: hypothetical protein VGG37_02940 [Opitutaceae bacterium]|jgi:hypothetical protein